MSFDVEILSVATATKRSRLRGRFRQQSPHDLGIAFDRQQ